MIRLAVLSTMLTALLASPALAQAATVPDVTQTAYGLPLWAWALLALVVIIALFVALNARQKSRQAVIKTRIG